MGRLLVSPHFPDLTGKKILLMISGGIAAYKALELIRLLRQAGASVRCVLTAGGARFVTALSIGTLCEDKVYSELWSLTDEAEMGHIRLSREADLVVVAPASADLIAKMAHGFADDLASTVLLAADKPILVAPAMNIRMWEHPATTANMATLVNRGVLRVGPEPGAMACGEYGIGRMAEPAQILAAVGGILTAAPGPMTGRRVLVTSGPTQEAVDPVRFITNRSSGKQGHAIATAFAALGAETILVTGPTAEPDPSKVSIVRIESAAQMMAACLSALPVDVAVCAAAVSDWRPSAPAAHKLKKRTDDNSLSLQLTRTEDILGALSRPGPERPALVVGFALETENLLPNARAKLRAKKCDWIIANSAAQDSAVFGSSSNSIVLVTESGDEHWPQMSKAEVGRRLAAACAEYLAVSAEARATVGVAR
jgi:phosphopantothenoylcysteine decarboxylase/phosphopantothenate--cysteine ligase